MIPNLFTATEIAEKMTEPFGSMYVMTALEELAERGTTPITTDDLRREIAEMSVSVDIAEALQIEIKKTQIACSWVLPEYQFGKAGFVVGSFIK